uniref:Uncharacterized protein n=1 Tax=Bracon brevicornis TaxID=1563983 RepID=A0A6V7IP93_9HYME
MRFLTCSQCLSGLGEGSGGPTTSTCDPLLITKRPITTTSSKTRKSSVPREHSQGGNRFVRLPGLVRAALNATWQRRQRSGPRIRLETPKRIKKRDIDQKEKGPENQGPRASNESRDPRIKKSGNWGQLSTLDFRRINTIAIPYDSTWNLVTFQNKFDGNIS